MDQKPAEAGPSQAAGQKVEIDMEKKRYVIHLSEGDCELTFDLNEKQKILTLLSTNVPHPARGQGMGNKLADKAFEMAIYGKYAVVIKCPFVAQYYKDNKKKIDANEGLKVSGPALKKKETRGLTAKKIDKNL